MPFRSAWGGIMLMCASGRGFTVNGFILQIYICRPPNLCNWKIGMILLKNRKEIAFPIGVCSKIILKNRKILSKPIKTWAGNGQNSDSFLQIHNGWEVCICDDFRTLFPSLLGRMGSEQIQWASEQTDLKIWTVAVDPRSLFACPLHPPHPQLAIQGEGTAIRDQCFTVGQHSLQVQMIWTTLSKC